MCVVNVGSVVKALKSYRHLFTSRQYLHNGIDSYNINCDIINILIYNKLKIIIIILIPYIQTFFTNHNIELRVPKQMFPPKTKKTRLFCQPQCFLYSISNKVKRLKPKMLFRITNGVYRVQQK